MEIRTLCCSTTTSSSSTKTIHLGRPINRDHRSTLKVASIRSRWRSLWKKLMREKRKMRIFDCSAATAAQVHFPGYDPYTYAQNFDQGLLWDDEPDSLSRSFSMRFAAPRLISSGGVLDRSLSDVAQKQDVIYLVF